MGRSPDRRHRDHHRDRRDDRDKKRRGSRGRGDYEQRNSNDRDTYRPTERTYDKREDRSRKDEPLDKRDGRLRRDESVEKGDERPRKDIKYDKKDDRSHKDDSLDKREDRSRKDDTSYKREDRRKPAPLDARDGSSHKPAPRDIRDDRSHKSIPADRSSPSVGERDKEKKRYRDRSTSRDRYDDRTKYRDSRDVYDDRDRKRPRYGNSGVTDGRLTPRSQNGGGESTRTLSTAERTARDDAAKKAKALARLAALKKEQGIQAPPKKLEDLETISKPTARTYTSGALRPSRPSYEVESLSIAKKPDPEEIRRKAAAAIAKQRAIVKDESVGVNAAGLEEEHSTIRKMEKLPTLLPMSDDNAIVADDQEENDEAIGSDDEQEAAARERAQSRAVEAQKASSTRKSAVDTNVTMNDAEDDVDPLDAFMSNLVKPEARFDPLRDLRVDKKKRQMAFNSDDEEALDAIGIDGDDDPVIKKRRKDVAKVDHSKIQYDDFRKEFYSESLELAEMTEEEVDTLRAELDNIKVAGTKVPKPISNFPQGGFGTQILEVIKDLGFDKPTAIQAQALPAVMSGRDTLGVAKTGSGKTMAYLLPLFRHVKDQRRVSGMDGPIALVLAPTRELAVQIHKDCKPFLKKLDLRACCAYGGSPISEQIADLKRGAEIVVATPGRLIDLLAANAGRVTNLARVTYLVLDEADRMFDMGFEPQITRIINNIRPDRQTVLFSATFPKTMEGLARKTLSKPVEITVGGRSVVGPEITQKVEVTDVAGKWPRLLAFLGDNHKQDDGNRSLIFVERHEAADALHGQLAKAGYFCYSIHGGREQADRDQFISDFKKGIVPVLIATSVAARGLDVKGLSLVVNYDIPNHREDYVHRCGRTGRAGALGTAVSFIQPDQDRYAGWLVRALTDSKQEIPAKLQEMADEYEKKIKAGEAKRANAGFGGRGIERIEAARDKDRALLKKQYATEDGPEEETTEDKQKTEAKQSEAEKLVAAASSTVRGRDEDDENAGIRADYVQLMKDAMIVKKTEAPPPSAQGGQAGSSHMTKLQRAAAAAAGISNRVGTKGAVRPGAPVDNRGPDAGAFHAELQINDFPQKARWAVTNRTNVLKILEATGTSITSKGIYYPPGAEIGLNDQPKLYILVEGDTENVVQTAMRALQDHLRDGMRLDEAAKSAQEQSTGRYSVV